MERAQHTATRDLDDADRLLDAVRRLLDARNAGAVTADEWDGVEEAFALATEPPSDRRTMAIVGGRLVERLHGGTKVVHEIALGSDAYGRIAEALMAIPDRFLVEELAEDADVEWGEAWLAVGFLIDHGVIEQVDCRRFAVLEGYDPVMALAEWAVAETSPPRSA